MKKEYINPTIEIVKIEDKDIIVMSTFDPMGILDTDNVDNWF